MIPTEQETIEKLALLEHDEESLISWLSDVVLLDGEKAKTNLRLIDEQLQDKRLLAEIFTQVLTTADPDGALNLLERLFDVVAIDQLTTVLTDSTRCQPLLTVLGGSPFLAGILYRRKIYFENLFISGRIDFPRNQTQMLADLGELIPDSADFFALKSGLRSYKAAQILRIGSRDLCGSASLVEVMEE
ncbi:MAG: bifunctional [glutamate--ammonia ligase]-adenylyl-L-tyrosine phosphorylase/[glutamate--ammonia-ligase] adenylyltransferase, partial [Deltaproteobacteria bacterium]